MEFDLRISLSNHGDIVDIESKSHLLEFVMFRSRRNSSQKAFTLIELLVVISIIALLIGILLPALGAARFTARSAISLSNMKQIGIAVAGYQTDNKQHYPKHSSNTTTAAGAPGYFNISGAQELANMGQIQQSAVATWETNGSKPRWPDFMFPYINETKVFLSPNLDEREIANFNKPFVHTLDPATGLPIADVTEYNGGYGYNFQYIGNGRARPSSIESYKQPFHGRDGVDIYSPANTVLVGDTAGSRNGSLANEPGTNGAAVYSIDPPLGSVNRGSKGSRKTNFGNPGNSYYEGGDDDLTGTPETYLYRSFPDARNSGAKANFSFLDGSARSMSLAEVDDFDGDGTLDNGYWNGLASSNPNDR